MSSYFRTLAIRTLWLVYLAAPVLASAATDPELEQTLKSAAPGEEIPIILTLTDQVTPATFRNPMNPEAYRIRDKHLRRARIVEELEDKSIRTRGPVMALLRNGGASQVVPLWIINGIAAHATPRLIRALQRFPGVRSLTLDRTLAAPTPTTARAATPEWNLSDIHAPELWQLGYRGGGVVVANMDTGVDIDHPDLAASWRGGTDSWFDPFNATDLPYDAIGHGTETMGIMVGGSAGGTAIGVAPDADWIAAKIFDDNGNTTDSVIHQAFQWLLAPSGDPNAPDAPDVVSASWGLGNVDGCDNRFQTDFDLLRNAGIFVVFAAGNSGPTAQTSISPANNLDGFSAGAVDNTNTIAYFSSRGPSACTNGLYPSLVAPGYNVKTTDPSLAGMARYTYVSGTSFAAPHIGGAVALLLSAVPQAGVTEIEGSLQASATDLGSSGPDNTYGTGLINVLAAYDNLTTGSTNLPPIANDDAASMVRQAHLTIPVLANDSDPDQTGIDPASVAIAAGPSHGRVTANLDGTLTYSPWRKFTGTDSFQYTVADNLGAVSNVARVTVAVSR